MRKKLWTWKIETRMSCECAEHRETDENLAKDRMWIFKSTQRVDPNSGMALYDYERRSLSAAY